MSERIALSSNAFSTDDQIADVISWLSNSNTYYALMSTDFEDTWPEYNNLEWSGSWVDTENSGVDPDYMSFLADWIEYHTPVRWEDGEPFLYL